MEILFTERRSLANTYSGGVRRLPCSLYQAEAALKV